MRAPSVSASVADDNLVVVNIVKVASAQLSTDSINHGIDFLDF